MPHRSVIRSTVPLFALGCLFAAGCATSAPQLPQFQTAGMRVDVDRVSQSERKQRVDMRIRIWNDHDQQVTFDLGNVRLLYKGREVSAKPDRKRDSVADVQAKSNREFRWNFEVGDILTEGQYDVEIREAMLGGVPLGDTIAFKIVLGA